MDTFQRVGAPARAGGAIAVAVVLIVVGVVAILLIVDYILSPDSVSISGPATMPAGGAGVFTVTVSFDESSDATRTLEVLVYEDDSLGNDLLAKGVLVTIPANATSGAASVSLSCTERGLEGPDGYSGVESPYHVFAMYDRFFPLTNVTSANVTTSCAAASALAAPGGAGASSGDGTPPADGDHEHP